METAEPFQVVVIDDSPLQGALVRMTLERRFGERVSVTVFTNPVEGVDALSSEVGLLLVDWQMPELDGHRVVARALEQGVEAKRIIVSSNHPAMELHEEFDCEGCLAVIEKGEQRQQEAFLMILDGLVRRHEKALRASRVPPS